MYLRSGALAVALLLAGCAGGPSRRARRAWISARPRAAPGHPARPAIRVTFPGAQPCHGAVNYDVLELYVARPWYTAMPAMSRQGVRDSIENFIGQLRRAEQYGKPPAGG